LNAKAAWVIETLRSASLPDPGVEVAYPGPGLPGSDAAWAYFAAGESRQPTLLEDGLLDFGDGIADPIASAFWHLSRWEERDGAPQDRHGRFPLSAALADPEQPAVDAILVRFQQATGLRPRTGLRLVLSHDIDTPVRWSGRRSAHAAAARLKAATLSRDRREASVEARGLAAAPLQRLRGRDPNWSFRRMHEIEQAHGGRSTHFLMVGHDHPLDGINGAAYDRVRARIVELVTAQGDEVGLHPSYTTSEHPERLAEEKDRLEQLTGRPLRSARFHFLRHRVHRSLAELDRLGFRLDSSHGYSERPGFRAGFSHPYRPYDLAADRPLDLVEVPLAVMDATLQDDRYLNLDAEAGLRRAVGVLERAAASGGTVSVLWHNDRFAPIYARGWDIAYDRLLSWARARGAQLIACEDLLGEPD
jgi:hypothetical protein